MSHNEFKQTLIEQLQYLQTDPDTEIAHSTADALLCDLLINLGYEDVVREYNAIPKWYA